MILDSTWKPDPHSTHVNPHADTHARVPREYVSLEGEERSPRLRCINKGILFVLV